MATKNAIKTRPAKRPRNFNFAKTVTLVLDRRQLTVIANALGDAAQGTRGGDDAALLSYLAERFGDAAHSASS